MKPSFLNFAIRSDYLRDSGRPLKKLHLQPNIRLPIFMLLLCLLTAGCEKKPADEVKTHLEKAMTDYLTQNRPANAPPPQFQIEDVAYFKIGEWYRCQFKVKLHRSNGTDTTGMIQGKISTDYATVIK